MQIVGPILFYDGEGLVCLEALCSPVTVRGRDDGQLDSIDILDGDGEHHRLHTVVCGCR